MKRLIFVFTLTVLGTAFLAARPARAQEEDIEASPVPAVDDPRRPQLPQGAGKRAGLASILFAPLKPLGNAMESGAIWYEENCGSPSGGLAAVSTQTCFPPWLSVHFGSVGTRSGFLGGGFGLHYNARPPSGLKFGFMTAATARGYSQHDVYVGWNDPLRMPAVRATAFYDFDARNDFFGLGPDSDDDDLTNFAWERFGADVVINVPMRRWVWGEAGVRYEKSFLFEGRGDVNPDTVEEFPELAGAGDPQQELWGPHVRVVIDVTDLPGQPSKGFKLKGGIDVYRSVNDLDFDWNTYSAEAQFHLPLAGPWHVLSVVFGMEEAEPDGDSEIPFAYLPTLGGSKRLRGFDSWRFRDRAVRYGTIAYRYLLWVNQGRAPDDRRMGSIEAVLFADVGAVGRDQSDLDENDVHSAYGFEWRVYFAGHHAFGIGFAGSDEGPRLNIALEDVW